MNTAVFNKSHILFEQKSKTKDEAFRAIAQFVYEAGFVRKEQDYYEGLKAREQEATTGFKDHIAIPHCKHVTNVKSGLFLVKFQHDIPWNALDGQPVNVAFALTIPPTGATAHLKLLSLIARKLIDQEFREGVLRETNPDKLTAILEQIAF